MCGVAALMHGVASGAVNGVNAKDGAGKAVMGGCAVGTTRGKRAVFEGQDGHGSSNGRGCTTGMDGATDLGSVPAALWTRDGGCTGTAWKDRHTKVAAPCKTVGGGRSSGPGADRQGGRVRAMLTCDRGKG